MNDERIIKLEEQIENLAQKIDKIYNKFMVDENQEIEDAELYEKAKEIVVKAGKATITLLQRKLDIGFARSARLLDLLEQNGVIGPANGTKPRNALIKKKK